MSSATSGIWAAVSALLRRTAHVSSQREDCLSLRILRICCRAIAAVIGMGSLRTLTPIEDEYRAAEFGEAPGGSAVEGGDERGTGPGCRRPWSSDVI
jgi:hypothetical protein